MKPIIYSGWPKGMDNRRANHDVPLDTLRDGLNVDVLTSGKVRLRSGITQAVADTGAHSVFSDGTRLVWATPTTLKTADGNFVKSTLLTDTRLAKPLSYVALHGEIYFSNEDINGKINAAGEYEPWGIVGPTTAPVCSAVAGVRRYQVTCTFVTASGEESGAPLGAEVLCSDIPSIQLTSIPQSSDSRVVATRIYVTNIDGTDFYAQLDIPTGITAWTLTGFFANGARLRTQFMAPPPPGQLLEYLNGVLYVASGSAIYHTDPLRYVLCAPEGFFMEPKRVTLLKAVDDGVYVSSDQTYFLAAPGTKDVVRKPVLPYRAVEGAAVSMTDDGNVMWLSERGFVLGGNGGEVKNLTEGQLAMPSYERGCLGIVERDGHTAAVAVMQGEGTASPLVSEDYEEPELL